MKKEIGILFFIRQQSTSENYATCCVVDQWHVW